jgi:hypothetical protein
MKTIPILSFTACEEPSGQVPKLDLPLTRREFLKGSGVLMGTIAAGSLLSAFAPSSVWAVEMKVMSQAEGEALLKMTRTLFPHQKLSDAVYALVVKDLDAGAATDAKSAGLLKDGVAALNKAAGGNFAGAAYEKRLDIIKGMEGNPFFSAVRGKCVTSLYDNDMSYVAFGYPGSSWDKGGYITRGFQDLKWLPEPTLEESPKPYMG